MITPQTLRAFFERLHQVREMQGRYRSAIDERGWYLLPPLEDDLDRERLRLSDELGTGDPDLHELYDVVEDLAKVPTNAPFDAAQLVPLVARARNLLRSTSVTPPMVPVADTVRADAGHAPPAPKSMEGGAA